MKNLPLLLHPPQVDPEVEFVVRLKEKFSIVINNQSITSRKKDELWTKIFKAHNPSSRAYHNLSHLYSITEIFDQFQPKTLNRSIFYWITFFHDYIYKSVRKDNEAKSAALAKQILTPLLPQNQVEMIAKVIESTASHIPMIDIPEQFFFLDADLAILAAEADLYDTYTQAIRQEYRIYPDLLYRPGRKKVLAHFLDREQIYYTTAFQAHEEQARANLQREMINL